MKIAVSQGLRQKLIFVNRYFQDSLGFSTEMVNFYARMFQPSNNDKSWMN
jgi:hypothetical protein